MHADAFLYLPFIFSGHSILARFDYSTLREETETGTLLGWWIGELGQDLESGDKSVWPPLS